MWAISHYPFCLCFWLAALTMLLRIPTAADKKQIQKNFVKDLESFTYSDKATNTFQPCVCSCCDGTPTKPDWYKWVSVPVFAKLCGLCKMQRSHLVPSTPLEEALYPAALLNQYRAQHDSLKDYILSPKSCFNDKNEVIVCKKCLRDLKEIAGSRNQRRKPPGRAIASGYLTGDPPEELKRLSRAELSLISAGSIDCQSYVFFGGCHQQIRGWHTIYNNRPAANVSNLEMLASSGMKGNIVVVLCGPFTTTQQALVKEQCLVRPSYVIEAFNWLKTNNYLYKDFTIPEADAIPLPIIHQEQV